MHDRTRRFWVLTLFFAGGPLLTALVLAFILVRSGYFAANRMEKILSDRFDRPVSLEKVRFIRPRETWYAGITISDKQTRQSVAFCPELYTYTGNGNANSTELAQKLFARESVFQENNSDFPQASQNFVYWVIPKIYIRYSTLSEVQKSFSEWLSRHSESNSDLLFFEIQEAVIVYNDIDFQEKIERDRQELRHKKPPRHLANMTKTTEHERFDSVDISVESIQKWLKRYNSVTNGVQLTDLTGSLFETAAVRQWNMAFYFKEIPVAKPVTLQWKKLKAGPDGKELPRRSSLILNAVRSPLPCSFASVFASVFYLAGTESWLDGLIRVETVSSPSPDIVREGTTTKTPRPGSDSLYFELENFHLRRCDLQPLAKRISKHAMTGTLGDLFLEKGSITDGVFSGKGSIFLIRGALDRRFLLQIRDLAKLEFEPTNTLMHRFENDQVLFDELAFSFDMRPDGLAIDSKYPRRIIAFYRSDTIQYGIYLPQNGGQVVLPWPELVTTLATEPNTLPHWSPLYRDALNHLLKTDKK